MKKIKPTRLMLSFFIAMIAIAISNYKDTKKGRQIYFTEDYRSNKCMEAQLSYGITNHTTRSWVDLENNDHCIDYVTADSNFRLSRKFRNTYQSPVSEDMKQYHRYWGMLYKNLYVHDKKMIQMVVDSLWKIKRNSNFNREEFANVIVTFVQDIPYSYVLGSEKCEDRKDNLPCIDKQKYGVLSPFEFLHTLTGDCDTRSVVLYSILKHFNYAPKIAISLAYRHSMLLLDIVSTGDYLTHLGQKFYFWETTGTGWQAGVLPPDMNKLKHWKIALH